MSGLISEEQFKEAMKHIDELQASGKYKCAEKASSRVKSSVAPDLGSKSLYP